MTLVDALLDPAFDEGTDDFQPTNLEVTSIDVGNPATNVIPAQGDRDLQHPLQRHAGRPRRCRPRSTTGSTRPPADSRYRKGRTEPIDYRSRLARPAEPRLPDPRRQADRVAVSGSIEAVTGRTPALSTSGGTSDARFIKDYCPVVEFGLVGKTMHMVDERVALADLETLTRDLRALPRRTGSARPRHGAGDRRSSAT